MELRSECNGFSIVTFGNTRQQGFVAARWPLLQSGMLLTCSRLLLLLAAAGGGVMVLRGLISFSPSGSICDGLFSIFSEEVFYTSTETNLSASIDVVRLLISREFAFRGHDESKSSLSRETVKAILEELNGDYFAFLVDESFDVSRKEQMAIVFRYIDRMGFVMERLIDIVHVEDTSASSLKEAIFNLLAQHSLSPSSVCGQCYAGASNMQGEINGLEILIRRESKSAHSIHCFAHQL
ncbi:hypothetical protein H5410_060531 [Solanum commersonii]|uniref:DUF4371 domain-containing protein n=1 Tax=Solanum commersonii TaxID=4109 RepID=A0A9J5W5B4_SOLCO|nr:hypothetical protein H5410_060531 [Solanum commersonii]